MISINIPVYNRKEMIRECLESFLKQTYQDFEIIVVDDGSEEDLSFIANMDKRIKYIRQEHKGIAAAFNLALRESRGEYVMPFGSDDIASDHNFLQEMWKYTERFPHKDVFYCDYWQQDNSGKRIKKEMKEYPREQVYERLLKQQFIPHPGSLWREKSIPYYDESLDSAVDWELFLKATEWGIDFKHVPQALFTYRVGHQREGKSKRQAECCDIVLRRRGYIFNRSTRRGNKIEK